ncbi:two-component system, NtrC family, nitrogen regulation response regulator NtrX [Maridesulfovibrio ferrireducens]|uniref:Two-component system, NtrC family, nitrogen regulation response regulator NtrX n=1 Tax=Maridesulfovibrio ferrireducens TaxID=246191 RepID=A0A1G9CHZ8_9BACT|nr:sigma-54 dependent transcriptional regulator [Maridesulfovibrio ferrireducens]SDK51269.1 two-component system, NtrC family, nitrogen regulation response regulator NtrX [Maridesulfovibrio ferrireducens]
MSKSILIVDDEDGIRYSLRGVLEDEGFSVSEADSGENALKSISDDMPDLVFLDIWLPGMDGLEVLDRIKKEWDWLPVVMISGHGNIETAVSAIKKGAFDFIEKPLSLEKVVITAEKAVKFSNLQSENKALRTRIETEQPAKLTGRSEAIVSLREIIGQVAPTDAWVLITGENGTGKEIVARSIHSQSLRKDRPLVAVNCAAIPEELIESELFGHEKGAFTGAERAQEGKFELADTGTLFLDEIGDMSLKTQAKILRILQEQCFERVGGRKTINVNVRVIAATNKDLFQEIKNGNFREDLYYRLKVFPLEVAPLRDRSEDIPLLIEEFITRLNRQHGFKPLTFTNAALKVLSEYAWPGNVRELKNFVERMLIIFGGKEVGPDKLPPEIADNPKVESIEQDQLPLPLPEGQLDFKKARADFEAQFLETKLKEFNGSVSKLAEAVGLERSSLYRKLKSYEIQTD